MVHWKMVKIVTVLHIPQLNFFKASQFKQISTSDSIANWKSKVTNKGIKVLLRRWKHEIC